jgi:hypothetical protein
VNLRERKLEDAYEKEGNEKGKSIMSRESICKDDDNARTNVKD